MLKKSVTPLLLVFALTLVAAARAADRPNIVLIMADDLGFADLGCYGSEIGSRIIDPLQGKSLVPIFDGETRAPHDTLYFHFGTDRALRQGPWKLVSAKKGKWELYNMDDDRTELNDLADADPGRVAAMEAEWFNLAENVDRLSGGALDPVLGTIKSLSFRKDTSDQGDPPFDILPVDTPAMGGAALIVALMSAVYIGAKHATRERKDR